jgi:hypothetical protein
VLVVHPVLTIACGACMYDVHQGYVVGNFVQGYCCMLVLQHFLFCERACIQYFGHVGFPVRCCTAQLLLWFCFCWSETSAFA